MSFSRKGTTYSAWTWVCPSGFSEWAHLKKTTVDFSEKIKISSLIRGSSVKQTQTCPVPLVRIGLQTAVKQAFMLALWDHPYKPNPRLVFLCHMCIELLAWLRTCMYGERNSEKQGFAYQLRRGVLLWLWLLGTRLVHREYVSVRCLTVPGMSTYCNCERRDASSNLMLTKY